MIRAHLRRSGALDRTLNVQRVRLACGHRAPPRSWTLLLTLAAFLRQAPSPNYSMDAHPVGRAGAAAGAGGMGPVEPFPLRETTTQRPQSGNGSPGDRYGVGGGQRTHTT